ncbi:C40 family peptidase [Pontibacillus sp. HMF3514]|uniref:C40 family peptidase n=1 Tax=Pontibacillus sp. HMF3514 TaxID=2692425 RepID=UPI00131FAADA|nr:C40 family peptidase [Pontibacillus sp. HMF3514]QHE53908.1 LysM peptidoglycan-binding domain-containing protein [Pontibacillus sp. HMF3514]
MKKTFLKKLAFATSILSCTAFATSVSAQSITVQSGDTLWKLAQKHDVSTHELIETNNLSSPTLHIGQSLTIPNDMYTVQSGDSLWKVSQRFNTSIQAIKRENQLSSNVLHAGQALSIPEQASTASTYDVQYGDTLWIISQKFGVSIQNIMNWNNLSSTQLYPGQTLHLKNQQNYLATNMIETAKQYMGTPYVWGGDYPSQGFDCSGFLKYVFGKHDVEIPRTVATIYQEGTFVSKPERGDLVFFETYKPGASHAGIYLGDGKFVHASSSKGVTISSMSNVYWEPRYLGAKSYY